MMTHPQRAVHRPISIIVEDIFALPMSKDLPADTQLTVNLKLNREMRKKFIKHLQAEEEADPEWTFVSVNGYKP